jgi:hypothetical protein
MSNYVYRKSEPNLYTVGFYRPDGAWEPESDWDSSATAALRVHYLNGGLGEAFKDLVVAVGNLSKHLSAIELEVDLLRTDK